MRHLVNLGLLTIAIGLMSCPAFAVTDDSRAVKSIDTILVDPLLPESHRGSKLKRKSVDIFGRYTYDVMSRTTLAPVPDEDCSIRFFPDGTYDYTLALDNDDVFEVRKEPDWAVMQSEWDSFVSRHWPNLKLERKSTWHEMIRHFQPGGGVFNVLYELPYRGVSLYSVKLSIRLSDAKIGGISVLDVRPALKDFPVTDPPSDEYVMRVVARLFAEKKKPWLDRWVVRDRSREIMMSSRISLPGPNRACGFLNSYEVVGTLNDGRKATVYVSYLDPTGKLAVSDISFSDHDPALHPYTMVDESNPHWASDTKLYWTTSRDVLYRPWWQRTAHVDSIAYFDVTKGPGTVGVLRPIKPGASDLFCYVNPVPNADSGLIAVGTLEFNRQLWILNAETELMIAPQRDLSGSLSREAENGPEGDSLPEPWPNYGISWIPGQATGMVASLTADRGANLYLLRLKTPATPNRFEQIPLVAEVGDDVVPCVGNNGQSLAWGHEVVNLVPAPDKRASWQLVISDLNASLVTSKLRRPPPGQIWDVKTELGRVNTPNRRTIDLAGKPNSISWDSSKGRWLVVLEDGSIEWVLETKGKLSIVQVGSLKWNDIPLRVRSAELNPSGSRIAVAAELPAAISFAKTECTVRSTIFLWDGRKMQVSPIADISKNGLERLKIGTKNGIWAHVRAGAIYPKIRDTVDPNYCSP